jgi:HEAT repeat protein
MEHRRHAVVGQRGTDEVFGLPRYVFKPKVRGIVAKELAKRYQAGEKEILPRVIALLQSEHPRFRDGALRTLGACGDDTVLENLSKLTPLLGDPKDFVQITAVKVISKATDAEDTQLGMLKATIEEPQAVSPNSVGNSTQHALFGKDNPLANTPFESGFDEDLVREALEDLILLDPAHRHFTSSRLKVWDKDTIVKRGRSARVRRRGGADRRPDVRRPAAKPAAGGARQRLGCQRGRGCEHPPTACGSMRPPCRAEIRAPGSDYKRGLVDPDAGAHRAAGRRPHQFLDRRSAAVAGGQRAAIGRETRGQPRMSRAFDLFEVIDALIAAVKEAARRCRASAPTWPGHCSRPSSTELDGTGDPKAQARPLCRKLNWTDLHRKTYFRKMAAMDFLVEMLQADALADLLPYLGQDYWRLRQHSRKLAVELVKTGAKDQLATLFTETKDPTAAAGILEVFATCGSDAGLKLAKDAMTHDEPVVRKAAVKTAFALGGDPALPDVLAHLKQASTPQDLHGCEEALLSRRDDPAHVGRVRDAVIDMLPNASETVRPSLYYLLAQLADPDSIAALRKAAKTDSLPELGEIVLALSYSPSREADNVLLEIAGTGSKEAGIVGAQSVRRMVLGPQGFGDITNSQRLDFAEPMLKLDLDQRLIAFLANVHEARALRTLMYCLEKGVESAAESLISNAEGFPAKISEADAKIAAKSLQDVIEYIEVTRLRGGVEAHMKKEDNYYGWKTLQARAGKVLLKIHQPERAPIPTFDPLDLDP